MGTIRDYKYKIIKNFLTEEELNLLMHYCRIKHRANFNSFDDFQNDLDGIDIKLEPYIDQSLPSRQKDHIDHQSQTRWEKK